MTVGALNFAGGLLAWGLLVPLLVFFLGPDMISKYTTADGVQNWASLTGDVYKFIVRPIAVGGMLVGACYTLWKMRKNLILGVKRGVADVRKAAAAGVTTLRTERDLSFRTVLLGVGLVFLLMIALYLYFIQIIGGAILAAIVMLITGFFFAAVSGNLVGLIGSSNNPISGLTLATVVVAALTIVTSINRTRVIIVTVNFKTRIPATGNRGVITLAITTSIRCTVIVVIAIKPPKQK